MYDTSNMARQHLESAFQGKATEIYSKVLQKSKKKRKGKKNNSSFLCVMMQTAFTETSLGTYMLQFKSIYSTTSSNINLLSTGSQFCYN